MAYIYLNESSMLGNGTLSSQWSAVDGWFDLVKYLEDTYRIPKIGAPKHFYDFELCDYKLNLCFNPLDKSLDNDKKQLLLNLASYIESSVDSDFYPKFVFDRGGESTCLGAACVNKASSISFTFDKYYATSPLKGHTKTREDRLEKAEIYNIYDQGEIYISNLVPFSESKRYDAGESPMWNLEMMEAYCEKIGHKANRKSATSGEKIAYLRFHGRILAEMNGWRVDENKTKLNQSDNKQRLVFRSKNFKNEEYYLSIDFEKEDFHYELHDHNGIHLREINWKGVKTGEADMTHNLKMRKERKKK